MAHGLSSTLRALAWLRWRLFLNGAVHGMRRDMLRRFAGWAQPVVFVAMSLALVPAAIVLSGVALFAGFGCGKPCSAMRTGPGCFHPFAST